MFSSICLALGFMQLNHQMTIKSLKRFSPISWEGHVMTSPNRMNEYARAFTCLHTYNASGILSADQNLFVVSFNRYVCNIHACMWRTESEEQLKIFNRLREFLEDNGYYANPMFKDEFSRIMWDLSMYEDFLDSS